MISRLNDDVIAIACSDLHLDEHAWADRPNIAGDSMWAFKWICELANQNNVPLLIAGDILDKQTNNSTVIGFIKAKLEKLTNSQVYFIQGQHDMQDYPWMSCLGSNCHWIDINAMDDMDESIVPIGHGKNIRIIGIDWSPASEVEEVLKRIPEDTDVLMMHQVTKQLMEELGPVKTYELDLTKIPHVKLLILGDFHRTRNLTVTGATGQALHVISPGSTNMRSVDEPCEKFVVLIKRDMSTELLQIPTRQKLEYNIFTANDLNTFAEKAATQIRQTQDWTIDSGVPQSDISKPLVWVKFDQEIEGAYNRIREIVGQRGHLFTKSLSNDPTSTEWTPQDDEEERQLFKHIEEFGPLACLPLLVNKEEDPEAFNLLQRLLTESDPRAVIEEERAKYLKESAPKCDSNTLEVASS